MVRVHSFDIDGDERNLLSSQHAQLARYYGANGRYDANAYERDMAGVVRTALRSQVVRFVAAEMKRRCAVQPFAVTSGLPRQAQTTGTGNLLFTPAVYRDTRLGPIDGPAERAHEVFVHELVHVVRRQRSLPTGPRDVDDEVIAVMICNYYCQEVGRPLRADHRGHRKWTDSTEDWLSKSPAKDNRTNRKIVEIFIRQQPSLAAHLKPLAGRFAPVALVWS